MFITRTTSLKKVITRALGAKVPKTFFAAPVKSEPRAKRYGAKSAKKVRAKQYVTFLFGANLREANLARTKQYSTNWSLVRFGLSRQTVRDFSERTRKSPCFTPVLTFLNFFARRLAPRELAFSPGPPFPPKIGAVGYVPKLTFPVLFGLKQKKHVFS